MKTLFVVILFSILSVSSFAHESYPERSDWEIVSKVKDSTLKQQRTRITFLLSGVDLINGPQRLVWSANKWIDTLFIDESSSLSKVFISGNYNFKFYVNKNYREIIIPKLILDSGYSITVQLNFRSTERQNMMVKKPVIYLYPEKLMLVDVKVKPKGNLTFSYPEYNDGWTVQADSTGELTINEKKYNYLFWESEQDFTSYKINYHEGFLVNKEETIAFLESKLTEFGLTTQEQSDFITFWGPQLMKNNSNFVQFKFNEEANDFAELTINPKPNNVNRIYLVFANLYDHKITSVRPQTIPKMNRNGFTIVEWGGFEFVLKPEN